MKLNFIIISILLLGFVACSNNTPSPTPTATPDLNTPEGRGKILFSDKGRCATCHSLSAQTIIVGPSLANIATIAESRVSDLSAEQYLIESITQPDAYKTPNFEKLQMDTSLAKELTIEEIEDLVAFMLTLK